MDNLLLLLFFFFNVEPETAQTQTAQHKQKMDKKGQNWFTLKINFKGSETIILFFLIKN